MSEVLNREELAGLTIYGEAINAQVRDGVIAIRIKPEAEIDVDGVCLVPYSDIAKLAALVVEDRRRG